MKISTAGRGRPRPLMTMMVTAVLLVAGTVGPTMTSATAAVPSGAPVAEFFAPRCAGETDSDPQIASAADHHGETDLTRVFGARLDSYNAGNVVPLYDSYGWADAAYPPLCATYYDPATDSAQSVWMFCTDVNAKVCGDIGPGGTLTEGDEAVGNVVDVGENLRLNADQELIIGWLLENEHSYVPSPGEPTTSVANQTTSSTRFALQNLIWCVSDPDLVNEVFQDMCATNMPPAEKARILEMAGPPSVTVTISGRDTALVGTQRTVSVRTNVFNQPITLTRSGTAQGDLRVCGGPGTLNGNTLVVQGTAPARPATVTLCLNLRKIGSFRLRAAVTNVPSQRLEWDRSASKCQVFVRARRSQTSANSSAALRVVRSRPTVASVMSQRSARPGARLAATVRVKGLRPGHGAVGSATLYGPLPSRGATGCTTATALRTVTFRARNGTIKLPSVKVDRPGWYTWVARTSADPYNEAATHGCARLRASTVVSKAPYPLTTVATGFHGAAPSARRAAGARSLRTTGVDARWVATGRTGSEMVVPADAGTIGWLRDSAAPGDAIGTTVMAGHVSDRADRPGALFALQKAKVGQRVTVRRGGQTLTYRVTRVHRQSRTKALPADLFRTSGAHRLVLISCTNKVLRTGGWHYADNVVVVAVPVRR